jgi:hypothetical protein
MNSTQLKVGLPFQELQTIEIADKKQIPIFLMSWDKC